ncbi:hypothetical protein KP509_39G054100 [Ceratopteris richardii]|uniref:Uncharacterized protein n=1 Tax=Ceratopteris richardii TaxID=49495 RepID=A0A8T2Q1C4_CERRI|nr:hypothetical protein KP509_39G054100 [Ceratopteris richardii]
MEEKKSESRQTQGKRVQQSNYDALKILKDSHMIPEAQHTRMEPKSESISSNILSKCKIARETAESLQHMQYGSSLLRQPPKQEEKENRDTSRPCLGKGSTKRQSHAMVYLENALDEMEVIVGSISDKQNKMGRLSALRLSWDFSQKEKEENFHIAKGTYLERKWRDDLLTGLGSATKASHTDEVSKLNPWKQSGKIVNKDWLNDRTANIRSRGSDAASMRLASEGMGNLKRSMLRPPKPTNFAQDRTLVKDAYLGVKFSSPGRSEIKSSRTPSKVQLSPASESLLKRLTINQQPNVEQQKKADNAIDIASSSPDKEDDRAEYDRKENGCDNEICVSRSRNTNNVRDSESIGGISYARGEENIERQSESREPSADLKSVKEGTSFKQNGFLIDPKSTVNECGDVSDRPNDQVWSNCLGRIDMQQPPGFGIPKRSHGALGIKFDGKAIDSFDKEPTTPIVREKAGANQINDKNLLQNPVNDFEFTGSQLMSSGQNIVHCNLAINEDGTKDNGTRRFQSAHVSFLDHKNEHTESRQNDFSLNGSRDEIKLVNEGQEGTEFPLNSLTSFPTPTKSEQTNFVKLTENLFSLQQRCSSLDHGLSYINELPKLVNRISKLTANIDSRSVSDYLGAHEGSANLADKKSSDYSVHNVHDGRDSVDIHTYKNISKEASLFGLSLPTRGQQLSNSIHLSSVEGHVRWSSADLLTPLRENGQQRKS